ncbi:hypothetical protein [Microbacterium sp. GXS0129]|uniref:hypothetical protein n=1 Tax=Microbacterium sp. GXS0129 TaxID=3377836 RepID=UPI00383B6215
MSEQLILNDLVSKWVSLTREYVGAAPDVSAYYLYGLHERIGTGGRLFSVPLFEQKGAIVWAGRLVGAENSIERQQSVLRLMNEDFSGATAAFDSEGIPAPTEYRIYYEPGSGKLDAQLSREVRYYGTTETTPLDGVKAWLGTRMPER